jgi:hypothetical protein
MLQICTVHCTLAVQRPVQLPRRQPSGFKKLGYAMVPQCIMSSIVLLLEQHLRDSHSAWLYLAEVPSSLGATMFTNPGAAAAWILSLCLVAAVSTDAYGTTWACRNVCNYTPSQPEPTDCQQDCAAASCQPQQADIRGEVLVLALGSQGYGGEYCSNNSGELLLPSGCLTYALLFTGQRQHAGDSSCNPLYACYQ